MEGRKKLSWEEEDLAKAVKILAGTATVPLKVAADIASDITGSLESYVPKPTQLASTVIDVRINTLKTVIKVIEKEISLLEKYRKEFEAKEETKETVKVE
jgi:outer membrane translocation and assembly module TamA